MTLTASVDLFQLNDDDRKFIFELIDKLREYEKGNDKGGKDLV